MKQDTTEKHPLIKSKAFIIIILSFTCFFANEGREQCSCLTLVWDAVLPSIWRNGPLYMFRFYNQWVYKFILSADTLPLQLGQKFLEIKRWTENWFKIQNVSWDSSIQMSILHQINRSRNGNTDSMEYTTQPWRKDEMVAWNNMEGPVTWLC